MRLKFFSLATFVMSGSMLLAACGGGNDSPLRPISQVQGDVSANIDADLLPASQTAVQSVLGQTFYFPSGIPSLGTSGGTTVKLSGSGVAPTFEIVSGSLKASGPMSYGSCIFTIDSSSTFVAPHRLAYVPPSAPPASIDPNKHVIEPCSLTVATDGKTPTGNANLSTVTFTLDGTSSSVTVPVSIDANGVVTVNGENFGVSATIVVTTGAGG